jgi:membrane protein DedA with SNARE-associated domain
VVGALVLYYLGVLLGRDRIRAIAEKLPLVDVSDVDRTEDWFGRHGSKAVFFGRMIPVFRSLVSIPAGIERMPLPKFLVLTAAGSLVWNTALIMAGYLLGENWHLVEEYAGFASTGVLVLTGIAIAWFVVSRVNRRRQGSHDPR